MRFGKPASSSYEYVVLYAAVGDKEKAFASLERVNLKGLAMAGLKFDPQLDLLRGEVRFAQPPPERGSSLTTIFLAIGSNLGWPHPQPANLEIYQQFITESLGHS